MNSLEKFRYIHTFIFDVDGVLTNGKVIVQENGNLIREMSVRDGFALKTAIHAGFRIIIITGGSSSGVAQRLKNLGVVDVYSGVQNKLEVYEDLVDAHNLDENGILYMGDDLPDYEVMKRVGFPCCPADACPEIKDICLYISPQNGGEGCARDVIEKVLKLQNSWFNKEAS